MNAKEESGAMWEHAFGLRIMSIIENAKTESRYLKADYAGNEKFEVRNRDGMRWCVDLMKK